MTGSQWTSWRAADLFSSAVLARWLRGVTTAGALAGALCCFVLYAGGGSGAFAALITVFALAWITTRLGYQRKQKLGIAENRDGRKGSQVLANLGVATACAAISCSAPASQPSFSLAWQPRFPKLQRTPPQARSVRPSRTDPARLRTGSPVPAGPNGAVSLTGTWLEQSLRRISKLGLRPRWLASPTLAGNFCAAQPSWGCLRTVFWARGWSDDACSTTTPLNFPRHAGGSARLPTALGFNRPRILSIPFFTPAGHVPVVLAGGYPASENMESILAQGCSHLTALRGFVQKPEEQAPQQRKTIRSNEDSYVCNRFVLAWHFLIRAAAS